ncbi:MAG TPA: hypothetical protein ENF52_04060 [Chloroflexi bacterium]|nr:hypothetical protein [Chloroflexota bacterium]
MKTYLKMGLIVGLIGLVLNVCVAVVFGLCGPLVAIIVGAAAGLLTVQQEKTTLAAKSDGAREGALSAGIAGALVLIGQVLGAIGALILIQNSNVPALWGNVPTPSAEVTNQAMYYLGGMATGVCFGLVDVVLSVLTGALAGYLGTPIQPVSPTIETDVDLDRF